MSILSSLASLCVAVELYLPQKGVTWMHHGMWRGCAWCGVLWRVSFSAKSIATTIFENKNVRWFGVLITSTTLRGRNGGVDGGGGGGDADGGGLWRTSRVQRHPIDVWIDKIWDDSFIRAENNYCAHLSWNAKSFQDKTADVPMVVGTSTDTTFRRQCAIDRVYTTQRKMHVYTLVLNDIVCYVRDNPFSVFMKYQI